MNGTQIIYKNNELIIPNNPIIPFIEGDGIGSDIWKATKSVLDAAVAKSYSGEKKIAWLEILAGEKSFIETKKWLPEQTLKDITKYKVAIKGPLTTPIGGGIRSLNVSIRQKLNLYACVRPVRYFQGVSTPVKRPENLDVVIFRENTEDVYSGIEYQMGTDEALDLINFIKEKSDVSIRQDSGIGIKPVSVTGSKRLVRQAIQYAIDNNRKSVTLVHKGNIMKFTEGAFATWGYELAREEFKDQLITEKELWEEYDGKQTEGKIVINDRIADNMFQQILTKPQEYDVIATTNLNGDYLSDACAAQVGGLGMAPGANIGDQIGVFEATHGTAPKYAGQNKANPGSLILSGVLMLRFLGWLEAADLIEKALAETIMQKTVTYDLERSMDGATKLSTSDFGDVIIGNM